MPSDVKSFTIGLGWDTKCDLDSSVLLLDAQGKVVENVFYGNKSSINNSVVHAGDNLTGKGSGDDETIVVKLDKVDQRVMSIWPVISIYTSGQ